MKAKKLSIIILMIITLILLGIKVEATTGKVNSETVRIRKEPNTKSTIKEQLDKGAEVEILEEEDGWYKVKTKTDAGTITGYISKELIDVENVDTEVVTEPIAENEPTEEKQPEDEQQVSDIEPTTETIETSTDIKENEQYILEQETSIRAIPLINSKVKTTINGNVKIIEIINDWCKIENETEDGWIRKSILQKTTVVENNEQQGTEETQEQEQQPEQETSIEEVETTPVIENMSKTGYVSAEGLIVREEPSTSSKNIDSLSKNDKVDITGQTDGWYQIKLNGKTGYVSSKYISDTKVADTTSRSGSTIKEEKVTPMEVEEVSNSDKGLAVVEYAKTYLGYKYISGGSSPETGFDCSGFTSYVYKNFGVSLSRTSKGQISDGNEVSKNDLQPGDLVVFNNSGNTSIGHVGIYVGDNKFIHAANSSQGVTITSLSSSYYSKRYVGARRVN